MFRVQSTKRLGGQEELPILSFGIRNRRNSRRALFFFFSLHSSSIFIFLLSVCCPVPSRLVFTIQSILSQSMPILSSPFRARHPNATPDANEPRSVSLRLYVHARAPVCLLVTSQCQCQCQYRSEPRIFCYACHRLMRYELKPHGCLLGCSLKLESGHGKPMFSRKDGARTLLNVSIYREVTRSEGFEVNGHSA